MPPKRKPDFLKQKTKAKAKAQDPQTEDDFLEVADEFERAAGKWRAGDPVKAARFFNRAIDAYNEGLKRYPSSFDLAYNKANLEYNITEDERIVSHFGDRISLLEETLQSHRFATSLDSANTDVLFNTAQVLASLAEAIAESNTEDAARASSRNLIEEAVDIFTKCMDSQQREYEQIQAEISRAQASQAYQDDSQDAQRRAAELATVPDDIGPSSAPEEWAHVVEPVTPETILETCTAQLGALTTLLGLYDPADLLSVETKVQSGLTTATVKIPTLINLIKESPFLKRTEEPEAGPTLSIASTSEPKTTPTADALLAAANFQASIAEVTYRSGRSTSIEYANAIEQLFSSLAHNPSGNTTSSPALMDAQSAYADALMDLASAVSDNPHYTTSNPDLPSDLDLQWSFLARAQNILTALSSAPHSVALSPSRLADIYLARGDADLFRFHISLFESAKPAWANSRPVLVTNAGVFYRGARTYADKAGSAQLRNTADAKAIVAEISKEVFEESGLRKAHWCGRGEDVRRVLEDMVGDGIVGRENAGVVVRFTE